MFGSEKHVVACGGLSLGLLGGNQGTAVLRTLCWQLCGSILPFPANTSKFRVGVGEVVRGLERYSKGLEK